MGLLSSLFGGGGGGGMSMPAGGGGLAEVVGGGRGNLPMPPSLPVGGGGARLPSPPPLPVGGSPMNPTPLAIGGGGRPNLPMPFQGSPSLVNVGPAEPVGGGAPQAPMQMRPGTNPNSIPGGPATSWRPQSTGQLIGKANQMLTNDTYENLSKSNPQFQKIMQNLDGSILKSVPEDSRPTILDNIGNLRSQIGNQLIPQLPGQQPQMQIGNQITDNPRTPLLPGQGQPPLQIGKQSVNQPQIPLLPGQSQLPTPRTMPDYMKMAHSMVGLNEHNNAKTLQSFFRKSLGQGVDPRNTAWCAAFANGVLKQNGLTGTGSLMARSFLGYGKPVNSNSVQQGDIAVFGRGKAPFGHVGFVDSVNPKNGTVRILSGNQANAITLKNYPINSALGFRRVQLGQP